ncbi:tolkin [Sarotherodon galilaeus]
MDPQTILCDMCIENRKPAKKTCMKCEISMCVQHLQAHLTTPVLLQTHPLTEPMDLCGNTKCSQHGKLLEYYCLDDMTCVCVSCATEDQHRLHNMKTFSTAHKELLEKLKAEQLILQEKTDDENVSLEKWEKSEREKLGRCSVRLTEAVTNLRDISLTSVQSSVSARMVSLKTSKSSLEAAQKEKDTFRFLQMYSQVHQDVEKAKTVDLRKGLEPGSHRDKLVEEIRQNGEKMVSQASQFWGSLLTVVDPEHHQELVPTGSDLIFKPQSLDPGMSLSKDKRKVFHNSWLGQCCATLLICSTKTASSYQRWVVSLSEESDWTIGLCDKKCAKNLKNGAVYGLYYHDKQLRSLTTRREEVSQSSTSKVLQFTDTIKTATQFRMTSTLITYKGENGQKPVPRPEKVEVLWNFAASTLSFIRRTGQHQREEIITMKLKASVNHNRDLVPFVQLGKQNIQNTTQQQQWKCSCGKDYYWDGNGYRDNMSGYSLQGCCSCGKVLSVTEMVCKLC